MKIKISNLSSMPIYQQIASEIRNKILSNELMSNTQLPSIRALSNREEILVIKKGEYLKEIEKVFEKALDDGLTKVDVREIIEIVLGERDYGNKAK